MHYKLNNISRIFIILSMMAVMVFAASNSYADELQGTWQTDEQGKKYYYVDGQAVTGIATIDGKTYYFSPETGAMRTKTGVFTFNDEKYYTKSGVLKTGWIAYKDKAYYFNKSGDNKFQAAKDTKIGYLSIPEKGYLGKAYYLGIKKLNNTKWTLKQAYKNSYKLKYANRSMRRNTSEKYAIYGFEKKKGNCYCMASTFYIQAKLLGYNVRQIEGKVNKYWPHSWTQIKHGKKWYVYDPNFRNETGRSGWKIYYGKKGTWKYMNYHVFQK